VQSRWMVSGTSFLAANELIAHFGLPSNEPPASLEVIWGDGFKQTITDVATRKVLTVTRN